MRILHPQVHCRRGQECYRVQQEEGYHFLPLIDLHSIIVTTLSDKAQTPQISREERLLDGYIVGQAAVAPDYCLQGIVIRKV